MSHPARTTSVFLGVLSVSLSTLLPAQDWPQWRGPHGDAQASGFTPPKEWPGELAQAWKVTVGDGVATPSLVGDRLYVFSREGANEVVRCLEAASGKEVWKDEYPTEAVSGPARGFPGPRSSPAVSDGKVVTLGAQGMLSCYDAKTGKLIWRHDESEGDIPRFAASSSPIITDGVCIAQIGSSDEGGIAAYDLTTGKEKWKWTGDGPAYGSPVLATVGDTRVVFAPTNRNMVAVGLESGKQLWEVEYEQGRYNAATPVVTGETLIYAGPTRGMTAKKIVEKDETVTVEDLWSNTDNSVQFNTPAVRDGLLFGLSNQNILFCIDAATGKTAWSAPFDASAAAGSEAREGDQEREGEGGRRGRRGGRGGRGGGRGGGGYGSVVDAGSVLFALTPAGQLTVFERSKEKLNRLATYKVAEEKTYAYPVISGNRIFIKDGDSVALWTLK